MNISSEIISIIFAREYYFYSNSIKPCYPISDADSIVSNGISYFY